MAEPAEPGRASAIAAAGPSRRDPRLDVFRGLALVMIFVNHIPGTIFEHFTSRNFGFSDAAEGFVVMSGMAAGLAYSGSFDGSPLWSACLRIWGRAWTLYLTHMTTTSIAIGISAGAALAFGVTEMIRINNMAAFFDRPLGVMVGLPTLGHQLGYFNILPLYMVLLLATPAMILIARRSPLALLALSVGLWFTAGMFRLNMPNFPNPGGWFFNPFAWQLIFVVGLLTGMAMRDGRRLVPVDRRLLWSCAGFLTLALAWQLLPPIAELGRGSVAALSEAGLPFFVAGFDKAYVAVPRLLHVLALVYVISTLPAVSRIAAGRWAAPLGTMGRFALPVFATGSVLSILGQSIEAGTEGGFLLDLVLIFGGLAVQLGLAYALLRTADARRMARRPAPAPRPATPPPVARRPAADPAGSA